MKLSTEITTPQEGEITICEKNLELLSIREDASIGSTGENPDTRQLLETGQLMSRCNIVLTRAENAAARQRPPQLLKTQQTPQEDRGPVVEFVSGMLDGCRSIFNFWNRQDQSEFPSSKPLVKSVAWHKYGSLDSMHHREFIEKYLPVVAVAYGAPDGLDYVRVYNIEHTGSAAEEPLELHSPLMHGVSHMEWKPFSGSILAVACQYGTLIWNVKYGTASYLRDARQNTVSSLSFSPDGYSLATACASSPILLVWNLATERSEAFKRTGYRGINIVRWSSNGSYVFTSHPGGGFRVWETGKWSCTRWTSLSSRWAVERPVVAATWSSCGNLVVFALEEECVLYTLRLGQAPYSLDGDCQVITDLGMDLGRITHLAWDPNDQRLAVSFADKHEVALLTTRVDRKNLRYNPLVVRADWMGWVTGAPKLQYSQPVSVTFASIYRQGSLLATCWQGLSAEDGRTTVAKVHFVPLLYSHGLASAER